MAYNGAVDKGPVPNESSHLLFSKKNNNIFEDDKSKVILNLFHCNVSQAGPQNPTTKSK